MAWTIPWNLIAMEVSGDIGDHTIYTNRFGKKVVFPKAPPDKPPTFNQMIQRARFKNAQASWSSLSSEEKDALEHSTKVLSAPLTGQNLWISCHTRNDFSDVNTFERQSGIALPAPVDRPRIEIAEIRPQFFALENTRKTKLQGRVLSDRIKCRAIVDFAIVGVPLAKLVGRTANDGKYGRAVEFEWLGGLGIWTANVTFSFFPLVNILVPIFWDRREV